MTEWWTTQDAGLIGAIGGGTIGILGGVLGTAIGYCAPKGIARGPIIGTHLGALGLGVVLFIAGIVAVSTRQPYHVFYPLLLGGGVLTVVMGSLFPVVRMRYAQVEHRRLEAEALRRG